MNAAKKIRLLIEKQESPEQVQVLKELAAALELSKPFDLKSLYEIDMRYFDIALELLKDWRFDHHISSRSKLVDQLVVELMHEPSTSQVPASLARHKLRIMVKRILKKYKYPPDKQEEVIQLVLQQAEALGEAELERPASVA
jgi:hypothetical protein